MCAQQQKLLVKSSNNKRMYVCVCVCVCEDIAAAAATTNTLNTMIARIKNDTTNWICKYLLKKLQIVWKWKFVNKAILQTCQQQEQQEQQQRRNTVTKQWQPNVQITNTVKEDVKFVQKNERKIQKQKIIK